MQKVKSILKRFATATAAALMGMSVVGVTAPVTPAYAASISTDDLYETMDEALHNLWDNGFDYYSAGTCTGTLARVLMHVDEVYGTNFGQIEYFIGSGPSSYLDHGSYIAQWSASQVINGAQEYGAEEVFVSDGIGNIDAQLDASDAVSGDIFVMENYPTGIAPGASGHCGFIQRIGGEVYCRQIDYDGVGPVRASRYTEIGKGGQIHIYRIGSSTKDVEVSITKRSTCTNVTDGHPLYTLAGAEYGIYLDSGCTNRLGTMTTDANGNATSDTYSVDPDTATLYVKELRASTGYKLDPTVYPVNIGVDGTSGHVDVTEVPVNDPVGIFITKKDKNDLELPAPLSGAEFTVKYYAAHGNSVADFDNMAPTRTWVIKTVEGSAAGLYQASLDPDHKVSGDDFYYNAEGTHVVLPLGAIIIQETKAPVGYLLEGATLNDIPVAETDGGAVLLNVYQDENGEAYIDGGQYLIGDNHYQDIEDYNVRGGIKFQKVDSVTKLPVPQGDATFANTQFEIINDNTYQVMVRPNGLEAEGVALNAGESYTITTDENGYFESNDQFLSYGKYTMRESAAPEGYTPYTDYAEDDASRTVMSVSFEIPDDPEKNGTIYDLSSLGVETSDVVNDMAKMGDFSIEKFDFEMGTDTQGDAPDLSAEFKLYNRSAKTVRVQGKDYAPGDVILTARTNEQGIYESDSDILPYGTYEIIETEAPVGYKQEGKLDQTFEIRDDHEHEDLTTFVPEDPEASNSLMNEVVTGHFELTKTRGKNNDSSTSIPEVGVEFAAIHKEFVDTFREQAEADLEAEGKFNEKPITETQREMLISRRAFLMAYQAIADATGNGDKTGYNTKEDWTGDLEAVLDLEENGLTKKEWSLFRTGEAGRGASRDLAYGDYVVGQTRKSNVAATEETDEREVLEDVWTFSVTTTHVDQETKYYTVVNNPQQYFLRVVKKDANTGEDVILNSADFQVSKIRDVEGNVIELPVTQNVGFAQYDTFETNAKNTAKGILDFRTYLSATDDQATVALPDEIEAGDYEVIETLTPWGFVTIDPVPFHLNENIAETDERGEFIAVVEINDERALGQIDLQKTIKEWDEADTDLVSHDFTQIGFTLKADEDIINPDDGELLYKKGDVINLINDESGVYRAPIKAEDYDIADVSEPTLDKDGHLYLNELPLGKYTLQETKTLDGLVVTDTVYTITFEQDDAQKVEGDRKELVTVVDNHGNKLFEAEDAGKTVISAELNVENDETHWEISKTDVTGQKELPGAQLTITEKATGEVVDEWTSTNETHKISGLKINTDYILTEIASPESEYAIAVPIEFHVENDKTVRQVHMVNKLVTLTKTDVGGEELPGAEMSVTDKDGNVVDEWTSTEEAHKIKNLRVGETYVLHENTAPLGFVKATDVEFTVLDDGADQHETLVDKILTVTKTDVTGGEELPGAELTVTDKETGEEIDKWTSGEAPHQISGLEEGRTYILTENLAPLGYVKASSVEFLVTGADENGKKVDQQVHMIDKIVTISKTDATDSEELPGAELSITDKETGEVIEKWTSGEAPHQVSGLEEGRTYILTEDLTPLGYVKASSIEFLVTGLDEEGKKVDQQIHMVDKIVELTKTDVAGGEELPGAHIIITNKETGEVVDEWTSTEEAHRIQGLEVGKTYIFHEEGAPDGHYYAADTEFFVDDDGIDQHLEIVDAPIEYEIYKINSKDGSIVPGVTLELVDLSAEKEEPADKPIHEVIIDDPEAENPTPAEDDNAEAAEPADQAPVHEVIIDDPEAENEVPAAEPVHQVYIDDPEAEPEFVEPKEETPAEPADPEVPVFDGEGKMVEGFPVVTTADGPIKVGDKLIAGHTYKLTETKWVKGVHKANSITFTVDKYAPAPGEDGKIAPIVITMVDEYNALAFQKVDDTGKPLAGAEFQILEAELNEEGKAVPAKDENGNVIVAAEFVSNDKVEGVAVDKNGVELASLLLGDDLDDETTGMDTDKVYILHETKAPFGYELAEDLSFTVTGTEEAPQVIRVADKRHHFYVSAVKVDATDRKKMLKGAEISIFNAKTNEIAKTVDGKDAKGVTDGRGVYMFELAYSEDGYYAKETGAPEGYLINNDKHEVKLSEDYNFAKDNPIVIVVADTPKNKTGVGDRAPIVAGGVGCAAAVALAVLLATRRKEDEAEVEA